jgi:hypothetical protein
VICSVCLADAVKYYLQSYNMVNGVNAIGMNTKVYIPLLSICATHTKLRHADNDCSLEHIGCDDRLSLPRQCVAMLLVTTYCKLASLSVY